MIILLEETEAWSLMMLMSAVAVDNAELSEEGKDSIRKWRNEMREGSKEIAELTDEFNTAINAHIDAKLVRRVKSRGGRAETLRR